MTKPIYIDNPIQGKDIKLSISGSRAGEVQKALEQRSKILGRVKGYEFTGGNNRLNINKVSRFTGPIYDLAEIARASDIEPYISQSIRKHREQILKEGYIIAGTEDELVSYVKQRLFEIALVTGITTEQWLRELVTNLITYHNSFLIFRRDAKRSSGKPTIMYGKELDPIAGIFVGDPTSMEAKVDKYGTVRRWRQRIEGLADTDVNAEATFAPEDVVHITVDKKTGFTFGTPFLLPVLDDIRALRKLEEVAIIIASKEAFPLYHYKVGTDARPAIYQEGGDDEVSEVLSQVQNLPAQGYVVTSERHEVKLISREGSALDLSPYLEYFESRVVAGLRLSPLDLGRGGSLSRGTATNLNQGLQDSAKDYQQVISDCLTYFVVIPLLLEGAFDITQENLVRFSFPTINREEERASQNHGLQLYMGNAISSEEFRKEYLNKQGMSEQQKADTPFYENHQAQKELAQIGAAAKAAKSSDVSVSTNNLVTNKGQPANQHGTKPAKSRFKANDEAAKVITIFKLFRNSILDIGINSDPVKVEESFRSFVSSSVEASKDFINDAIDRGYIKAKEECTKLYPDEDIDFEEMGERSKVRFFDNFVTKSYWKQLIPYKDQVESILVRDLEGNIDVPRLIKYLDIMESNINNLIRDQIITSERFGFIKFAKKIGRKTIDLINPDTFERIELDISKLIYKNFIPSSDTLTHYCTFSEK